MLSQRIRKELLLQLSGIIFLIGFYWILRSKSGFTEIHAYTIAVTVLLTHLLVSFVAFLEKNKAQVLAIQ
jgi:NADH:ubiquinone oxidoreductase subunit K